MKTNYQEYTKKDWDLLSTEYLKLPNKYSRVKYAVYSISLCYNFARSCLSTLTKNLLGAIGIRHKSGWSWWNPVSANKASSLYLGALPISYTIFGKKLRNDEETLDKLGVKAVLSITESFENSSEGRFLSAITPDQWKAKKISHLQLATPDFQTISMTKIFQGVEFIRYHLLQGNPVYIHCKAGRSRSALITLCYLVKYENLTVEEAVKKLTKDRPQVSIGKDKLNTAKEFEKTIR